MPNIIIKPFTVSVSSKIIEHFQRHKRESGINGIHFMPFTPGDPEGPQGISIENALLPLDKPGWQRWFYAEDTASGDIIGHVDLKSSSLKTRLHRCDLEIGIEKKYRGQGLGERLMLTAIEFAQNSESLAWIDLGVFSSNLKAYSLYKKLGFEKIGIVNDKFRILDEKINDIEMVLNVEKST